MFEDDGYAFDTLAVRAGQVRSGEGEHSEAMFLTSSYVFPSAEEAAARFSGESSGNVYSRYTNPTVRMFEDRMAALEGGEAAVATASGMAAILSLCMALLKSGDSVICSRSVFGTTTALFARYMKKFGVRITFVDLTDMQQWRDALDGDTKLLFMETPSNPLCEVADIRQLADLAHSAGALLAVDNCFCTPALQRPLSLGADIVVHSATKYLDGQGRCVGGVAVGRRELMGELRAFLRTAGPSMSPFNAWVFLKGLETLSLRMQTHSRNALALAWWLDEQEAVEKVNYTGLPKHPGHLLAAEQQSAFGGMLSFSVRGGREAAWKVIDNCKILSCTANLGDAKTTIVHPATTTHGRLSEEERARAGISESLIRVSVGLEDVEDLQRDLLRGLSQL
ncbi:O-succinylhomoserine sulfhydrylase [Microbulbifer thermotolerans]|uniref:O-succinylhomoserine sulfhydrylase n=1 Tax=Microbulbifer thermotolerans TaxID=252514 RepID=A0AB35HWH3_MICTH|nr:O-succinylhomoserine sulfhydrylase [Microbulbifer thermotolerans]MCX2778888.1 O-succinylhomoserine sulfhydrylase [Microbulbifer thermotolerans]MCX2800957.1 O-succinylhomoserine sulfhydrylase [Microbulbifer thermotolerans]MCX2804193.1 O-succinylhomoserine sulfhydrylase [Microbulbifer thermotolerans]MCX2830187.1 O-succinylhomoserine sulfhydrylase [Microbulbifer thermotolerans]MCX2841211.1 O-succinylhomoserine sulfhydrylase [Microbulbifer thermotolerans]